jgi:Flp pilus assembly protein TadG
MASIKGSWRSERGAELIEFALIAPILIFIIAGIVDFGMMFRTYEAVTNAAREGARVGVLPGYNPPDVGTRVNAYLAASGLTAVPLSCAARPGVCVQNQPVATAAGVFTARAVTVNYTYQFAVLGAAAPLFGGNFGSINLNAVSVMRTETAAAP